MKLVYIHGAGATGASFNYIRDHLPEYTDELILEYNINNGFDLNLQQMHDLLKEYDDMFFICHSMGGLYALHLANLLSTNVQGAVTMSTPYGGSQAADYAKYFAPFSKLLREIGPRSQPMVRTHNLKVQHPWCNIVSTRGDSPWMLTANDGVVTVDSQKYRSDMEHIAVGTNHYEIVIYPETVNIIRQRLGAVT